MKRFFWKVRAFLYMRRHCGWASWSYVDTLYETYVVDLGGCTPEDAVSEDFSYWDE